MSRNSAPGVAPFMRVVLHMGTDFAGNFEPNRAGQGQAAAAGVPVTLSSGSSLSGMQQQNGNGQQGWAANRDGCQDQHGCPGVSAHPTQPSTDDVVTLLQQVIPRLSPQQAQAVQWVLGERLTHQSRGVLDRLGELPQAPMHQRFVPDASGAVPAASGCQGGPQGRFRLACRA